MGPFLGVGTQKLFVVDKSIEVGLSNGERRVLLSCLLYYYITNTFRVWTLEQRDKGASSGELEKNF